MKTIKIALFALAGSLVVSCSDLDLSPRDKAASGSWFQTAEQFELNLNALLHQYKDYIIGRMGQQRRRLYKHMRAAWNTRYRSDRT